MPYIRVLRAGALAIGLAVAAPAHADREGFIVDLANNGWDGPVDAAVALGNHICSDIATGVPETETLQTVSDC